MILLYILLALVVGLPLALILYRSHQGQVIYGRAVEAFGKNNVVYINRAYLPFNSLFRSGIKNGVDSAPYFSSQIKKNPDVKIIVTSVLQTTSFVVCDPEMIRRITNEYSRNVQKRKHMVFVDGLIKGLIFAEDDQWKKSRGIISNLFHFEMLKNREGIMHKAVERLTVDLHTKKEVDLFKLGCTIAGEIVIESLLGKDFMDIRFGENTPLEEIQGLIVDLVKETLNPINIFRSVVFGRLNVHSKYLIPSQRRVLDKLLNVKRVGHEYLQLQKEKQRKGEAISPFIEAFLNLNDESYYDEVIQHLIIFVFAGEDTTGSLIEVCLYWLAERPQYQDAILESLEAEPNPHNNKTLNNFIQEANRLAGPARVSLMRAVVEPFIIDSFEFRKGDACRLGLGITMTNVKYFDDPWEFKPDRFNSPLEHPNAFMPFSGGPRNCIGQHMSMMEIRIALVDILKRYRLERTSVEFHMNLRVFLNQPLYHNLVKFIHRS